jgi:hypothetical protein
MYQENVEHAKQISNGVTQEQNMQLMCLKYDRSIEDGYKLKANREFLFMMKVLLKEATSPALRKMPFNGFYGTKRIETFDDELTFVHKDSIIEKVQMSSEPKRNFVLLQMDGIIFKYDLVTKELLFRWKTESRQQIILFDRDDKLCTVSDHSVKLWDFDDTQEQPPTIMAIEEFSKK